MLRIGRSRCFFEKDMTNRIHTLEFEMDKLPIRQTDFRIVEGFYKRTALNFLMFYDMKKLVANLLLFSREWLIIGNPNHLLEVKKIVE